MVHKRSKQELSAFDRIIYFNLEQTQVLDCRAKKQIIVGEFGTGKTVLLMQKALIALSNGEKVVFAVRKRLKPKYDCFQCHYRGRGSCTVLQYEDISLDVLKGASLFIDEFSIDHSFDPTFLPLLEQWEAEGLSEERTHQSIKAVIALDALTLNVSGNFNLELERLERAGFQFLILTSIMRNSCDIVKEWNREGDPCNASPLVDHCTEFWKCVGRGAS